MRLMWLAERPHDLKLTVPFDTLFAASGWRRTDTRPVGGGYSLLTVETA